MRKPSASGAHHVDHDCIASNLLIHGRIMAIKSVMAILTVIAIPTVIYLSGIKPGIVCKEVVVGELELETVPKVVFFLITVETDDITQVFASHTNNIGGIDIGGWNETSVILSLLVF